MTNNPSLNDGYLVIVSTDVRLIKRGIVNNAIIIYIDLASTIEAFVKWDIEVVGDSFLAILFWLFCVGFWSLLPRGFALWRHLEYERTVIWKNVVVRIMRKKKKKTSASRNKKDGKTFGGEGIPRSYASFSSRVSFSSNPLMHLRIPPAGRAAGSVRRLRYCSKASAHETDTISRGTRHQGLNDASCVFHVPSIGPCLKNVPQD